MDKMTKRRQWELNRRALKKWSGTEMSRWKYGRLNRDTPVERDQGGVMQVSTGAIKDRLFELGWSIWQLSGVIGITPANCYALINGKTRGIQFRSLDLLCTALDLSVSDILVRVEPEEDRGGEQ